MVTLDSVVLPHSFVLLLPVARGISLPSERSAVNELPGHSHEDNPGSFYLDSFCNLLKICDYHAFGGQDNSASKGKAAAKSFCDHISMGLS